MKKYRYCEKCEKGTVQNSEKRTMNNEKIGIFDRCFSGIFTLGFHELVLDKYWVCAECGEYGED